VPFAFKQLSTQHPPAWLAVTCSFLPFAACLFFRLYRDSTQYVKGTHVRDLSKLNRDMRQVMFITADPEAYQLQPENAIKVRLPARWTRGVCWCQPCWASASKRDIETSSTKRSTRLSPHHHTHTHCLHPPCS
jgi:hypothetical protein